MIGTPRPRTRIAGLALFIGLGFWVFIMAGGFARILAHASTPGAEAAAPPQWPAGVMLERSAGTPTLLMFVHPRCPCSRASLRELARLLPRLGTPATVLVVMSVPQQQSDEWESGDVWRLARSIPGTKIVIDRGGIESRKFGAGASGLVVAYSSSGRLLFSGGITAARGHEGASLGQEAIVEVLSNSESSKQWLGLRVFGCDLFRKN